MSCILSLLSNPGKGRAGLRPRQFQGVDARWRNAENCYKRVNPRAVRTGQACDATTSTSPTRSAPPIYEYAVKHFGGRNVYIEEMGKHVKYAEAVENASAGVLLRRSPPSTLLPSVLAYPEDLVIN